MGVAIDRRTAGVHPDPARLERLDRLDPAGEGVAESEGHSAMLALDLGRGPNGSSRASLSHQRPRGPDPIVPPAVWVCEASSPARDALERPSESSGRPRGLAADPPYTPGDAPSPRPPRARDAARLLRGADGGRSGPPGPDPDRRADDARSGRPGRRGQRGDHRPAVRVADERSTPTSRSVPRWPSRGSSRTAADR